MQNQYTLHLDEFLLNDYIPTLFEQGCVHFINDDNDNNDALNTSYQIVIGTNETPQQAVEAIISSCIENTVMSTADVNKFIKENFAILEEESDNASIPARYDYNGISTGNYVAA